VKDNDITICIAMNYSKKDTFDNLWQWKYDHTLSNEEERLENHYNHKMQSVSFAHIEGGEYNNIYWLLTQWRKNTSLLLVAEKRSKEEFLNLLSHRYTLNAYLNNYVSKLFPKKD
jgi:hypothetical protein